MCRFKRILHCVSGTLRFFMAFFFVLFFLYHDACVFNKYCFLVLAFVSVCVCLCCLIFYIKLVLIYFVRSAEYFVSKHDYLHYWLQKQKPIISLLVLLCCVMAHNEHANSMDSFIHENSQFLVLLQLRLRRYYLLKFVYTLTPKTKTTEQKCVVHFVKIKAYWQSCKRD